MSSVTKSSSSSSSSPPSSSAFHCRLFPKIFRKLVPQATTRTHRGTPKRRHSDSSTLVNPQQSTLGKNERRDFDAAFGALASKYGWGGHILAPLPSEPTKSRKKIVRKPPPAYANLKDTPTPPPSPPSQEKFTQAQREQALVDVMSRYSSASLLPGGRGKI